MLQKSSSSELTISRSIIFSDGLHVFSRLDSGSLIGTVGLLDPILIADVSDLKIDPAVLLTFCSLLTWGQNVHIRKKKMNLLLLAELNLVDFGCGFSVWFLVAVSARFLAAILDSSVVTCDRNLMPWEWFLVVTLSALLQMFSADCCQINIH